MEHIFIIGGGCTGAALAHDLTLRGFPVTLAEQGSLLSGTSGRHHGLLHSGARYALHDVETARECHEENQILRRLAPQAIEPNDGLFVALTEEDRQHEAPFRECCASAGIPTRRLDPSQALAIVPALNPGIKSAIQVPDAAMDAWRLPLHFFATARANGAAIKPFNRVEEILHTNNQITGVVLEDLRTARRETVSADIIINAAGPWAGKAAALADAKVPTRPGPGVMVSVTNRLTHMVINRLQPAGEGDILVPQRNLTVIGSTAWLANDPDRIDLPPDHIDKLITMGAQLIPALKETPIHAAWHASRPLLNNGHTQDPMRITRGFACIDHQETEGIQGLITLTGGKATTMRAMAQVAADLICRKTGRKIPCTTATTPLLPYRHFMQTTDEWM